MVFFSFGNIIPIICHSTYVQAKFSGKKNAEELAPWRLADAEEWQGIKVESFRVKALGFFKFEIPEKYVPQGKFRKLCTEVTISLWWCSQG